MNFTGTRWCHACIQLDKNVFNKSEFKKYADENLVLMEIEYRTPSRLATKKFRREHNELSIRHEVAYLPHTVLIKPDGTQVKIEQSSRAGVEAYIKHLKSLN